MCISPESSNDSKGTHTARPPFPQLCRNIFTHSATAPNSTSDQDKVHPKGPSACKIWPRTTGFLFALEEVSLHLSWMMTPRPCRGHGSTLSFNEKLTGWLKPSWRWINFYCSFFPWYLEKAGTSRSISSLRGPLGHRLSCLPRGMLAIMHSTTQMYCLQLSAFHPRHEPRDFNKCTSDFQVWSGSEAENRFLLKQKCLSIDDWPEVGLHQSLQHPKDLLTPEVQGLRCSFYTAVNQTSISLFHLTFLHKVEVSTPSGKTLLKGIVRWTDGHTFESNLPNSLHDAHHTRKAQRQGKLRHNNLAESRYNSQELSFKNCFLCCKSFQRRAINTQQVTGFGNSGLVPLKWADFFKAVTLLLQLRLYWDEFLGYTNHLLLNRLLHVKD